MNQKLKEELGKTNKARWDCDHAASTHKSLTWLRLVKMLGIAESNCLHKPNKSS